MANEFNYSEPGLAGGAGGFEELVIRGIINNKSGLHTPKRVHNSEAVNMTALPEDQRIPDFNSRDSMVYFKVLPGNYSREFVTKDGQYGIEFLNGWEAEAIAWKVARVEAGKQGFQELSNKIESTIFIIRDEAQNREELQRVGVNIPSLVARYNQAEEITPAFTEVNRQLNGVVSREAMFKSLEEMRKEVQMTMDLQLFNNDVDNRVKYYFGDTTADDVGFYRDMKDRIRAGYDQTMAYRSQQLVKDLLEFAQPEEYAVAKYQDGTIIYVLNKELSARLVDKFGSENALAKRWNDAKLKPQAFDPSIFAGFEHAVDPMNPGSTISANNLFGIATDVEKK